MSQVHLPVRAGRCFGIPNRRTLLRGLARFGLMAPTAWLPERAAAKKHKRRRKKKVTRNAFG